METKVLDQKNIADVVGQSEKEKISHFRISPLYSNVHSLYGGLSIGSFSKVEEDAKYSLNAGFLASIGNSKKSVNIGLLMGGGELSEYSLCISGVLGGFAEYKKSISIACLSCGNDMTSSINAGLLAFIEDDVKKSLNLGVVCAIAGSLENSVNMGGIASVVRGDTKNSEIIGLYNKMKTLTNSLNVGLVNVAGEDYNCQTGVVDNSVMIGLYNKTEKLTNSLEMGVINITGENLGCQIGIVNICKNRNGAIEKKETKGKSIGLVNIDLDKKWYESVSLFYR